jgi:hypothetical protein
MKVEPLLGRGAIPQEKLGCKYPSTTYDGGSELIFADTLASTQKLIVPSNVLKDLAATETLVGDDGNTMHLLLAGFSSLVRAAVLEEQAAPR